MGTLSEAFMVCLLTRLVSLLGVSGGEPTITPSQSVVIANESSDVRLTCIGQNMVQMKNTMFWKFDGRRIRNKGDRKITWEHVEKDKVNFTLEIKNVTQRDAGQYRCKLRLRDSRKTPQAIEGKIQLEILGFDDEEWPQGTYALPMPISGCPQGLEWSPGFLRQDTESTNPQTSSSKGLHLKGNWAQPQAIEQHYCVKTAGFGSSSWPAGSYCINKKNRCPNGFSKGWIRWDDEDTKNDNSVSGVLPDGSYDVDTTVYYCCRSDGSAESPIGLPTKKPFFLLKQSSRCQAVKGMRVSEEWVFWDCEDKENKNRASGALPGVQITKDIKLFYCYYFK